MKIRFIAQITRKIQDEISHLKNMEANLESLKFTNKTANDEIERLRTELTISSNSLNVRIEQITQLNNKIYKIESLVEDRKSSYSRNNQSITGVSR